MIKGRKRKEIAIGCLTLCSSQWDELIANYSAIKQMSLWSTEISTGGKSSKKIVFNLLKTILAQGEA